MEKKKDESNGETPIVGECGHLHVSAIEATFTHLICGLGLAIALWLAQSVNQISDPSSALRIICVSLVLFPLLSVEFNFFIIFKLADYFSL